MNAIVFSGTSEGKKISEYLNYKKIHTAVCVATEYGREVMSDMEYIRVHIGRLDEEEIKKFIVNADFVIDATHPYAKIVTQNIQNACRDMNIEYIRLLREETVKDGVIFVKDIDEAVELLKDTEGAIFVSTGSKELHKYCDIVDCKDRIVARVLPVKESEEKCKKLGLNNVIYKKGPFDYNENLKEFEDYNAKWLVTKSTGKNGGFDEKIDAAKSLDMNIIVVKRPSEDKGMSMEQIENLIDKKINRNMKFPLFIDIADRTVIVVGGGNIATRRINTLLKFGAKIKVIAMEFDTTKVDGEVEYVKKKFEKCDIESAFLVVGATDDRSVNRSIYEVCKEKNIFVSIADCKEECSFYFPAVCLSEKLSVGIVSDGSNHGLVRKTAQKIREVTDSD